MINLKGGAVGRESEAARHDSFSRAEKVLQDSGRECVCDTGSCGVFNGRDRKNHVSVCLC